jgi:hypothetical protein
MRRRKRRGRKAKVEGEVRESQEYHLLGYNAV